MSENYKINLVDIYNKLMIFAFVIIKHRYLFLVHLINLLKFGELINNKRYLI